MNRLRGFQKFILATALPLASFASCQGKAVETSGTLAEPTPAIERFDMALPGYIQEADSLQSARFRELYSPFFPVYCRQILGLGDAPGYKEGLGMFLSNEAIAQLYADTQQAFSNDTVWKLQLQEAFGRLARLLSQQKPARILTHISGLNQSVVTVDSLLSISIDCYLGENYPLYEQRYYSYERGLHTGDRIAFDAVEVWLRTLYPYRSQRNALLDRMVYEGKILYLLTQIFPQADEYTLLGYTDEQARWCRENETTVWERIVGQRHLFNTESMLIGKYIEPAPFVAALHQEAPGRMGRWVGLQIVKSYVKRKSVTETELLLKSDNAAEILSESKYNGR